MRIKGREIIILLRICMHRLVGFKGEGIMVNGGIKDFLPGSNNEGCRGVSAYI